MKIKYINFGTGNRLGHTIYLNEELKKYPELHDAILRHEERHTGRFSLFDFKLDFCNNELGKVKNQWISFVLKHPKSWLNFLPIMRIDKQWTIDISLTIIWIAFIIMFYLAWTIT